MKKLFILLFFPIETTLETQKDELSFLKSLIEKLLPPRGAL